MNVHMYGEPRFLVEVDMDTARDLWQLAKTHYDAVCKAAVLPGGILFAWNNLLSEKPADAPPDEKGYWPSASWRDLDLLAKVCEQHSLLFKAGSDSDKRVAAFAKQIGYVLRTSEQFTGYWYHDFKELT